MRLKKWSQAWKILLIQEKNSRVDHCDAQWIPACAGMTKKINHHAVMGSRHSRKTLPVIPAKAGIHQGAPVMKHPRSTSWPTNPTERSTYRRDQQPEKRVRVAGVPSADTNRALISSRLYQSMCFDNLINSWFMSSLFSRRTLNRFS